MRILDKYILKSFLASFLWCMTIFLFLYIIIDTFSHLNDYLNQKLALELIATYYLWFMPIIFTQVTPVAMMIATIYSLGALNKNNELIAMKASGLTVWHILRPYLAFGLFLSFFILVINDRIVPTAYCKTNKILLESIESAEIAAKGTINNIALYGKNHRMFFAKTFNISAGTLNDLIILEQDTKQQITAKIIVKTAQYKQNGWLLEDVVVYRFNDTGEMSDMPEVYQNMQIDIQEKPRDFLLMQARPEEMTYKQLSEHIDKLKNTSRSTAKKLLVDLYNKRAYPFINFVIVLLAAPFALVTKRGGALAGLGVSILLSFVYYVVSAVTIALGKGGVLFPFLSAWATNILFAGAGIRLIRKLHL